MLLAIATRSELFHDPAKAPYADVLICGRRETWPVASGGFERWLIKEYLEATGSAPSKDALATALGTIKAKAYYHGPERDVFVRVGGQDGKIFVDLASNDWRVVEIKDNGWRVIDYADAPVRFRRSGGMAALPNPVSGGSIDELRAFVNVATETDFVLLICVLLATFRETGPYPVLTLTGEHGSAKSTAARFFKQLTDPSNTPLRSQSRDERDLFIAASAQRVLAFDNLSGLTDRMSDALCRLSTGGGFATRTLYENDEETVFNLMRPLVLNGIGDFIHRPDLADRAVFLRLAPIPDGERRLERDLNREFEAARPRILAALFDGVATGLACQSRVTLERLPRMADFAIWATACETAYWSAGRFIAAYNANREDMIRTVVADDEVGNAILQLVENERGGWAGTMTALGEKLTDIVPDAMARASGW